MSSNITESVWIACSNSLRYYIRKRISNPDLVEDILQEVFVKIHSKIDLLKDDSKICSWVFQIAQNTIIDYYRKHKPIQIDIDTLHIVDDPDDENIISKNSGDAELNLLTGEVDQENVHREIASGLKEFVDQLPEKYAQAITLVELEGLSQTELAKKLGISISGAKSRVQRGRQMLKDALMNCCHFEFDKYGTILDSHPRCCCCCNN